MEQENSAGVIAKIGMELIVNGAVRNHKLGNSAQIHTGTLELEEFHTYRDFLPSKNCCMVMELTGSDCHE